jgi:hypothetical protein
MALMFEFLSTNSLVEMYVTEMYVRYQIIRKCLTLHIRVYYGNNVILKDSKANRNY